MVIIYTLLFLSSLVYSTTLECGIRTMVDNDLKKAITMCLAKNTSMDDVYGFSNFPSDENETTSSRSIEKNSKMNNSLPIKEIKNRKVRSAPSIKFNRQTAVETTTMTSTNQPDNETAATTLEPFPQEGACILQCILSRMDLTNEDGFPEQQKTLETLMKKAKGRELRDFLKDTTENCFQKLREDSTKNACDFSTELIRCLADEGKSNCGDWPAGDISLFN